MKNYIGIAILLTGYFEEVVSFGIFIQQQPISITTVDNARRSAFRGAQSIHASVKKVVDTLSRENLLRSDEQWNRLLEQWRANRWNDTVSQHNWNDFFNYTNELINFRDLFIRERPQRERSVREREERRRLVAEQAAREERERLVRAREERERLAAERIAREERERLVAEQAAREERERLVRAREERERLAAERIAREERELLAAERATREEQERLAAEQAAREEQERLAAERIAREERERLAAERAAREEQERLAMLREVEFSSHEITTVTEESEGFLSRIMEVLRDDLNYRPQQNCQSQSTPKQIQDIDTILEHIHHREIWNDPNCEREVNKEIKPLSVHIASKLPGYARHCANGSLPFHLIPQMMEYVRTSRNEIETGIEELKDELQSMLDIDTSWMDRETLIAQSQEQIGWLQSVENDGSEQYENAQKIIKKITQKIGKLESSDYQYIESIETEYFAKLAFLYTIKNQMLGLKNLLERKNDPNFEPYVLFNVETGDKIFDGRTRDNDGKVILNGVISSKVGKGDDYWLVKAAFSTLNKSIDNDGLMSLPLSKYSCVPLSLFKFLQFTCSKNDKYLTETDVNDLIAEVEQVALISEFGEIPYLDVDHAFWNILNKKQQRWVQIARRFMRLRELEQSNSLITHENIRALYVLATITDDIKMKSVFRKLDKRYEEQGSVGNVMGILQSIMKNNNLEELRNIIDCFDGKSKLILLQSNAFNIHRDSDNTELFDLIDVLSLNDEAFREVCNGNYVTKSINYASLTDRASEGQRFETMGNDYGAEVFLRALGIIFRGDERRYVSLDWRGHIKHSRGDFLKFYNDFWDNDDQTSIYDLMFGITDMSGMVKEKLNKAVEDFVSEGLGKAAHISKYRAKEIRRETIAELDSELTATEKEQMLKRKLAEKLSLMPNVIERIMTETKEKAEDYKKNNIAKDQEKRKSLLKYIMRSFFKMFDQENYDCFIVEHDGSLDEDSARRLGQYTKKYNENIPFWFENGIWGYRGFDRNLVKLAFRGLEKLIERYSRETGDKKDIQNQLTVLISIFIQGFYHCINGQSDAFFAITNWLDECSINEMNYSIKEMLERSISSCATTCFNSIFHFNSLLSYISDRELSPEYLKLNSEDKSVGYIVRHLDGYDGLEQKGLFYEEETMNQAYVRNLLRGDYGFPLRLITGWTYEDEMLQRLHLYMLSCVGGDNEFVNRALRALYNNADTRAYGIDVSDGLNKRGDKFYDWDDQLEFYTSQNRDGENVDLAKPNAVFGTIRGTTRDNILTTMFYGVMNESETVIDFINEGAYKDKLHQKYFEMYSSRNKPLDLLSMEKYNCEGSRDLDRWKKRLTFYLLKKNGLLSTEPQKPSERVRLDYE